MSRGRSRSKSPALDKDADMEIDSLPSNDKPDAKVVVVTNLTRNVVESHLKVVFGFYGHIAKIDLPVHPKSRQNRGKAALEFEDSASAHKAASHMNGGQLDGAVLKVELSDLPIRSTSRSRSPVRGPPRGPRGGRGRGRSYSRSRSRSRTPSRSRTRSRSPPPYRRRGPVADAYAARDRNRDSFRGRGYGRRGPPPRDVYRPGRSRTRSRSPIRRGPSDRAPPPRRRSPSYTRGGYGRRRSVSRSSSVRSSRSRTRSRSRSRSMSYSSDSRYSRSRSRTRSPRRSPSPRRRRSRSGSRDDIRDSRSRSPAP